MIKSKGIQEALISMLADLKGEKKDLITLGTNTIPNAVSTSIQMATVEFAGVKFKAKVSTGIQYIRYVQNAVLKNIVQSLPNVERVVLCEEKYSFTPDHFKAATHQQRKGEAEMAQIDWLLGEQSKLSPSMSACSILTSGDIGAIPIHLYSLSKKWPQVNGRYSHTVSVTLQKTHKKITYII
ncbi:unnamed protein product [Mytilus edulis]|uniref:Uncharacterized protein n=1 Tax=Mytilus edulis TaxID=6550 RepID=A0A8S3TM92_MYTED|nr:unnamed protein product [Mytilus edulis]